MMWKPNRSQWVAFGVGFLPVSALFFSGLSAFLRNDRQSLWPVTVLLGAVIALVTALTISWLEARRSRPPRRSPDSSQHGRTDQE